MFIKWIQNFLGEDSNEGNFVCLKNKVLESFNIIRDLVKERETFKKAMWWTERFLLKTRNIDYIDYYYNITSHLQQNIHENICICQ